MRSAGVDRRAALLLDRVPHGRADRARRGAAGGGGPVTRTVAEVTPPSAGLDLLHVRVVDLDAGESTQVHSAGHESRGRRRGRLGRRADGRAARPRITRGDVFGEMADLVYAPPRTPVTLTATEPTQIAVGQAPATGRFAPRLSSRPVRWTPWHPRGRTGPASGRLHAGRPHPPPSGSSCTRGGFGRGSWTGWPPHRHDGRGRLAPRLEETYYFRFDRPSGFGFHRNFAPEDGLGRDPPAERRDPGRGPPRLSSLHRRARRQHVVAELPGGDRSDRARSPHFDPATGAGSPTTGRPGC